MPDTSPFIEWDKHDVEAKELEGIIKPIGIRFAIVTGRGNGKGALGCPISG